MKIAVISDIHGNDIALDAVLADALEAGAEEYWFLGDYVALGPRPGRVFDRIMALDNTRFVRGNTDRYTVTGDMPPPFATLPTERDRIAIYANIASSFAWTRGYATALGMLDWLDALPLESTHTLAGGTRVLCVHAAPGTDDGPGVHPGLGNEHLAALTQNGDADVVLVGHTHEPMLRQVHEVTIINVGSVSNPIAPDLRACYLLIDSAGDAPTFTHRRVAYDHAAFAESVRRSRHPAADFIMSFQRAEQAPHEPHADHVPLECFGQVT